MWPQNFGEGGTPYNGLNGVAPPESVTFFKLQVYKRVGISIIRYFWLVSQVCIRAKRPIRPELTPVSLA